MLHEAEEALTRADYTTCIQRSEEAAERFAQISDIEDESDAWNQSGLAHLYMGEYDDAEMIFKRALHLDQLSGNTEQLVAHLNNLGNVAFFRGVYSSAFEDYTRALSIIRTHAQQPWAARRLSLTATNLAVLYEQIGQNRAALEWYKQAQTGVAALKQEERGQLLSNVGTLYRRLGDPAQAIASYRQAQKVFEDTKHPDAEIHVMENVGIVLAVDLKQPGSAIEEFTRALARADRTSNRRQVLLARLFRGEAYLRSSSLSEALSDFELALKIAQETKAREEQWAALFGLGRIHQRLGNRERSRSDFEAAIRIIESLRAGIRAGALRSEFLGDKRDVYDALIQLEVAERRPDQGRIFRLMEKARERVLQDSLPVPDDISLSALQRALTSNDLMLEYWVGKESIAVFAVRREESKLFVVLFAPETRLAVLRLVGDLQSQTTTDWHGDSRTIGQLLVPLLGNFRPTNLFIVPDGILSGLPFEGLTRSGRLLVEQAAVDYLPVASLLLRKRPRRGWANPFALQTAIFADPKALPVSSVSLIHEQWEPLPHSSEEARFVSSQLPGRSEVFTGDRNLKRRFLAAAADGVPVIHMSTHAAIDLSDPEASRLLFSAEPREAGSAFLFLKEIHSLKLNHTDLLTLSACETDRGKITPGEGIHSFSRAFLTAGASTTVTTLWPVADQQTAEFMKQFYFYIGRGDSKSKALQEAKLAFLHSGTNFSQPRYWAAFVLNGDGRTPILYSTRQNRLYVFAGSLVMLIAASVLWVVAKKSSRKSTRLGRHNV